MGANTILKQALNVSLEEMQDAETSADLVEQLREESAGNDLTPEGYVEDRLEVEQDISNLEEAAGAIENDATVSHESLDRAQQLLDAVVGRYGVTIQTTGLESSLQPTARATELAAQIRGINASLESALTVTMESYAFSDLWDHIGLLNREIPLLKDNLAVLKNYAEETAKLEITPNVGRTLIYQFRVDGSIPENIPKAAADTAGIVDDLIRLGQQQVDVCKKAAEIAINADWKDQASADKAMAALRGLKPVTAEIYKRFDETFTMGNRKLNVKKFDIKGAGDLGAWGTGGSLNVSWPKSTMMDMVFHPSLVMIMQGGRKRPIKIADLVGALDKMVGAAQKTSQVRSQSPKKWQEHKQLKVRMKKDVSGSAEAKAVQRAIIEADRLGWQCLNGALTILYYIIREINIAAERVAKTARKNTR
ncbi:hypothetical protein D3C76_376190 [compost metagenome]